ncbi:cell division protein SepF [Periweissella fabaria]|uniref:Cell division protein SepF n=2 Tax=Periweissella fabaria TaxID=546157 RepID=A0ABM8Z4Q5_9LACO|nr:cell division protein SepF [Periweissella fabaria]MCM0596743.1 cell division protein SepF [Periweissella fabaria]CAH0416331.1 Cell division protein SepF [Periweissella fabaria]
MAINLRNFFNLGDDFDDEPVRENFETGSQLNNAAKQEPARVRRQNVVSMAEKRGLASDENRKIVLFAPKAYSDVKEITDNLLSNQAVIVNFSTIDDAQAKRIVDFLTGAVFAINGEIQRVDDAIFLVTPPNYVISGEVSSTNHLND